MTDRKERLQKLRALALRGVGGEKETAQAILEKLLQKYTLSMDDLDENIKNEYELKYHGKEQEKLLKQTIYKVTDDRRAFYGLRYTESGRKCTTALGVCCTAAQKVEIEFLFDFYTRVWEKEREALMSAFIQKHRIFGKLKDGEKGDELPPEEWEKLCALMNGLSDEQPLKQLESHI